MWQDLVITLCLVGFVMALLPQIWDNYKKRRCNITYTTSIVTFIGMTGIAVAFLTLGLWLSFIIEFFTGTLWAVMIVQRWWYKRQKGIEWRENYSREFMGSIRELMK